MAARDRALVRHAQAQGGEKVLGAGLHALEKLPVLLGQIGQEAAAQVGGHLEKRLDPAGGAEPGGDFQLIQLGQGDPAHLTGVRGDGEIPAVLEKEEQRRLLIRGGEGAQHPQVFLLGLGAEIIHQTPGDPLPAHVGRDGQVQDMA